MNRTHLSALTLALATLSAGHALASEASAPKTREQVQAELAEAIRHGDILAQGEVEPGAHHAGPNSVQAVILGKTRSQVQAELAEAIRTGELLAQGEGGQTAAAQFPAQYPSKTELHSKTREEVKAELREAVRTHQMPVFVGG